MELIGVTERLQKLQTLQEEVKSAERKLKVEVLSEIDQHKKSNNYYALERLRGMFPINHICYTWIGNAMMEVKTLGNSNNK